MYNGSYDYLGNIFSKFCEGSDKIVSWILDYKLDVIIYTDIMMQYCNV